VQAVNQCREFGFVLTVQQALNEIRARIVLLLPVNQIFDQFVTVQHLLHSCECKLCVFGVEATDRCCGVRGSLGHESWPGKRTIET
jgi:hypothetical protein